MKKGHITMILVIALVVLVTAAAAAVMVTGGFPAASQEQTHAPSAASQPRQTEAAGATESQPAIDTMEFPIVLADGKLEIESLFPYTGMNPDDGNTEVKNIAAITLVNRSGEYLAEARITLALSSGTEASFVVTDLPAGKRVMAFCVDSTDAGDGKCTEVGCEAVFDPAASMAADRIAVSVDAMTVTLRNLTGEEISDMVIYCRCPLGEDYFGGVTYQYEVNSLPANGTAAVDAWDCVLGMAEVVRIEIKD